MSGQPKIENGFFYGTAWKEDQTETLTLQALKAGYRAIDTANQRKHYFEEGVGQALRRGYLELGLKREDLFLQTKFTYSLGQDHRKPYDEKAPFAVQVQQSFESSLEHLGTDYIDSYVLHGPSVGSGLTPADQEVWQAMEAICATGKIKYLGVSNVNFEQLVAIYEMAETKPAFVQNRCFAETRWDKKIREFCRQKNILYQGFSLLTANSKFLGGYIERPEGRNIPHFIFSGSGVEHAAHGTHPHIQKIVLQTGKNIQQLVFKFCLQVGMVPLTGTRDFEHMKSNLEMTDFNLSAEQIEAFENIAFLD